MFSHKVTDPIEVAIFGNVTLVFQTEADLINWLNIVGKAYLSLAEAKKIVKYSINNSFINSYCEGKC
jgi:hypothetical protein